MSKKHVGAPFGNKNASKGKSGGTVHGFSFTRTGKSKVNYSSPKFLAAARRQKRGG